jgi:hypothetical protein
MPLGDAGVPGRSQVCGHRLGPATLLAAMRATAQERMIPSGPKVDSSRPGVPACRCQCVWFFPEYPSRIIVHGRVKKEQEQEQQQQQEPGNRRETTQGPM